MSGINKNSGLKIDNTTDHIRQSISDIITTPVGTRVMRREYGSLIPKLIDQPLNEQTRLRLFAATAAALMRWEPRFHITTISMNANSQGEATVDVSGHINNQLFTTSIPIRGTA